MKSDFFRKHIKYFSFAAMTLTAVSSCKEKPFSLSCNSKQEGLLDESPQKVSDIFGTEVIVTQVNVPVYDKKGEKLPDRYILTRGQNAGDFADYQNINAEFVCKAYLNGDNRYVYLKVGKHGEIIDENGRFFGAIVGLDGQVKHIAARNMREYLSTAKGKEANNSAVRKTPKIQQNIAGENDSISHGTLILRSDSVATNDTLIHHNSSETVFTDTLKALSKGYE